MHNLQDRKRLRPLRKFSHTTSDIFKSNERNQEDHATENSSPKDGADEVVDDEVLGFLAAIGGLSGVHCWRGVVIERGFGGVVRYGWVSALLQRILSVLLGECSGTGLVEFWSDDLGFFA